MKILIKYQIQTTNWHCQKKKKEKNYFVIYNQLIYKSASHVRNLLIYYFYQRKDNTIKTYPDNLTSSFVTHKNCIQKS